MINSEYRPVSDNGIKKRWVWQFTKRREQNIDCVKNRVFSPGFERCPLSRQSQWCLVVSWGPGSTQTHDGWAQQRVAQPVSDLLHGLAEGFLILFCDQRGKPLVDDCSCYSNAACGRKNEWWKLSTFDFSYSLVISPFILHLVPATALSQNGVAVDRHEKILNTQNITY